MTGIPSEPAELKVSMAFPAQQSGPVSPAEAATFKRKTWGDSFAKEAAKHADQDGAVVALCVDWGRGPELWEHPNGVASLLRSLCSDPATDGEDLKAFTIWTEKRVYFPQNYEGSCWVMSVPRNPSQEAGQV